MIIIIIISIGLHRCPVNATQNYNDSNNNNQNNERQSISVLSERPMFLTSFEFNNVSSICYMCYRVHTIFFTKILSEGNFNNFILKHAVSRLYRVAANI